MVVIRRVRKSPKLSENATKSAQPVHTLCTSAVKCLLVRAIVDWLLACRVICLRRTGEE